MLDDVPAGSVNAWAIDADGRSILDAVETALNLAADVLEESRDVLARFGDMSSSTLLFVLSALLEKRKRCSGVALAIGPGWRPRRA